MEAHPILFVFAQKTDKFWFTANGMRTIHRWRSTGLQSGPHICAFGSQTIRHARVYEALGSCFGFFSIIQVIYHLL